MQKLKRYFQWFIICIVVICLLSILGLNLFYHQAVNKKHHPAPASTTPVQIIQTVHQPTSLTGILPVPKQVDLRQDTLLLPAQLTYLTSSKWGQTVKDFLWHHLSIAANPSDHGWLIALQDDTIPPQGYQLDLAPDRSLIRFRDAQSLYYALITLRLLKESYPQGMPSLNIVDYPDYPVRGVLLDISRDKIPTLNTLYRMVDYLALLKYNRLELYLEGFAFAYPSFRRHWEGKETPITPAEIKQLDQYCRDRFIDLVPNQNSLGHMQAWLATDEFASLAECPRGYRLMGLLKIKSTLDVNNPLSLDLVKKMTDDLLPNFSSSNFNINMDEPFELGACRNKNQDKPKLYLDYVTKLNQHLHTKNKHIFMWGDVVSHHPELLALLPPEITLLEWGYDALHPFAAAGRRYQQAHRDYFVCPGTSSWTSLTGRTDNMLRNIDHAAQNGFLYGASGFLNTDWGDFGHWQYLPVSIPGFTYGAAQAWHVGSSADVYLPDFMNRHFFHDTSGVMGQIALELGRYQNFEEFEMVNMTLTNLALQFGLMDGLVFDRLLTFIPEKILTLMPYDSATKQDFATRLTQRRPYDYSGLLSFLNEQEQRLIALPKTPENELYVQEYLNALDMIRLGSGLKYYMQFNQTWSIEERLNSLITLKALNAKIIPKHHQVWTARNKAGGLERSLSAFLKLQTQLDNEISTLRKPSWQRWFIEVKKHTMAAAGVLYLEN